MSVSPLETVRVRAGNPASISVPDELPPGFKVTFYRPTYGTGSQLISPING